MKKIFRNNRIIAVAFLTFFSTAVASTVLGNDSIQPAPVELKFAGMIKNDPLFLLKVSGNATQDEFIITIFDESGNDLYNEYIKSGNFSKKFLLNTEELGDEKLLFEVISRKTRQVLRYEISSRTCLVTERQ